MRSVLGTACCSIALLCAVMTSTVSAQSVTPLASFNGTNGGPPFASLLQGFDGNFYGTTYEGGANHAACGGSTQPCGTVFKVTPLGELITLYSFCAQAACSDGIGPSAPLVQALDGNFYGTTFGGGANTTNCPFSIGCGTVFKISPSGTLTTLYSFCAQPRCTDGAAPWVGLVQGTDGDFYGVTRYGGNGIPSFFCDSMACGTAFKITPEGTLTTLYSFCSETDCTDGEIPESPLLLGPGDAIYGETSYGGLGFRQGKIFKITEAGGLTTIYDFCTKAICLGPPFSLILATDGNFYGTAGGATFRLDPHGGEVTLLQAFMYGPLTLIQASDGNLYGTDATGYYGSRPKYCPPRYASGCGTVFSMTLDGKLLWQSNFCSLANCADGAFPYAALIQSTNGNLYSTNSAGGSNNLGVSYGVGTRLAPFVETKPGCGTAGTEVVILGNNLTSATSVTFNGTAATFKVFSSGSAIRTNVPAGATTGTVQVTTNSGTLSSNVAFRVTP